MTAHTPEREGDAMAPRMVAVRLSSSTAGLSSLAAGVHLAHAQQLVLDAAADGNSLAALAVDDEPVGEVPPTSSIEELAAPALVRINASELVVEAAVAHADDLLARMPRGDVWPTAEALIDAVATLREVTR